MDGILSSLTDVQRQAAQHVDGPLLVLAGPGSGKTRVITHRVAHLLAQGIPDEQIVALTFTNKSAEEMCRRLEHLAPGRRVWVGTFHRFCARLLRQHASLVGLRENFTIYDADDSHRMVRESIADANITLTHESPARIAAAIGWAKSDLVTAEAYRAESCNPLAALVERVYPHYQKRMLAANAVDFDDLLLYVELLLRDNPELRHLLDQRFRYIMVDEYQDTNLAQYTIVRALSIDYPNLAVTGDPDQSIYGWRGATIRNILDFEHDFPDVRVVRLEQNFRSTQRILRVADQLIANNRQRKEKALFTDNTLGHPVRVVVYPTGRQEAEAVAARIADDVAAGRRRPRDFAIFYRANSLSRSLERALKSVRLPYQIVRGLEFYQRKEIKDVLAYLQLVNNPVNDVAFLRVINTPPRHIGKKSIACLTRHARHEGLSLLDAARCGHRIDGLSARAAAAFARFAALVDQLGSVPHESVEEILGNVLHATGYCDWLGAAKTEENQQRLENIGELLTDAREFDETHFQDGGLEAFLEQASLVADVDGWESDTDRVTMMTLHAAKGLEFPVVFIVAVEQDMLPHKRSVDDPDRLEEERRLLFVGITRAREELHISATQQRTVGGRFAYTGASAFLLELPRDEIAVVGQLVQENHEGPEEHSQVLDVDLEDGFAPDDGSFGDLDEFGCQTPARRRTGKRAAARKPLRTGLVTTAAELAGDVPSATACSPELFHQNMVVTHPEYGLGKIISIGGAGTKRTATVQFVGVAGPKQFCLAFSPLRPARG